MIPKTLNELQDKLRAAANSKYADIETNKNRFWPQEIIPEQPIMAGSTILNNWDDDTLFEAPFTVDAKSGDVTLGDVTKVEAITNYEAIKWAEAEGSYEFIKAKICDAIQQTLNSNQYISIKGTWPDHVAVAIITENPVTYNTERVIFNYPYTIDAKYEVTLGTPVPAQEIKRFEAVKEFVFDVKKEGNVRYVTGPSVIPGCPDCDFGKGEKVFTVDEVAKLCHEFNSRYRLADKMHVYGATGETIGESVENWTTKEDMEATDILGNKKVLPAGTWMGTIKVTDPDTIKEIDSGVLKAFSNTYLSRADADKLLEKISVNKSIEPFYKLVKSIKRTLVKDLDDPVAVIMSIVDNPCVYDAIFTSVKSDDGLVTKAGRMLSSANTTMLQKTRDMIDSLLQKASEDSQTTKKVNKNEPLEVLDMEEKELKEFVNTTVKEAVKTELEASNKTLKDEIVEALKKEPEEEPEKSEKKEEEEEKVESVKTEDDPVIKGILDTQNLIVEKLGIDPAKKSLESPEPNPLSNGAKKRKSIREMAERK